MKRAWYLPVKHPETRRDRSNGNWGALLIIIWHNDGMIWPDDDMTNRSRWSLSFLGIRRDVLSVLSSNHFSSQQLANYSTNHLVLYPTCLWPTVALSSLLVAWIPLPGRLPRGLEGTTRLDNRYIVTYLVSFWWRLICFDLDPRHGLHRPPLEPGVQNSWDGRLSLGASPF